MSFDPDSTDVPTPVTKKSLQEELKERLENKPDPWTIRWIKQQFDEWAAKFSEVIRAYRGVCHTINIMTSDIRDLIAGRRKQDERIDDIQSETAMTSAHMGEVMAEITMLREEVVGLRSRNDAMGKWAASMEAWAVKQGKPPHPKEQPSAGQN